MTQFVVDSAAGWTPLTGATPSGPAGGSLAGTYPNPTLAASGVTAATYGDSTHVAQVTINAEGRITNASNVATGGGGTAGLVQLFASTLAVDTAAIDTGAGGIAAGHSVLEIWMLLRTDEAGAISNILMTFNNDAAAHYDQQDTDGNNTTTGSFSDLARNSILVIVHGSGGSANYASVCRASIPFYDSTTFYKSGEYTSGANDATAGNNWNIMRAFTYQSTAAISRMAVTAAGGAKLKAGSQLAIFGVQ